MLAPFPFVNGVVGAPGATFINDLTSGMWLADPGDVRFSAAGTEVMRLQSSGTSFSLPIDVSEIGSMGDLTISSTGLVDIDSTTDLTIDSGNDLIVTSTAALSVVGGSTLDLSSTGALSIDTPDTINIGPTADNIVISSVTAASMTSGFTRIDGIGSVNLLQNGINQLSFNGANNNINFPGGTTAGINLSAAGARIYNASGEESFNTASGRNRIFYVGGGEGLFFESNQMRLLNTAGVTQLGVNTNGRLTFNNLPTSAAGLNPGEVWRDGTTVRIVP